MARRPMGDHWQNRVQHFLDAILLARLPGVGAARFARLAAAEGNPSAALAAWLRQVPQPAHGGKAPLPGGFARAQEWAESGGAFTFLGDAAYPPALAALAEPPPYLFIRGAMAPHAPRVAVVGSREISDADHLAAQTLVAGLGGGIEIVSGAARGTDAVAHEAALAAGLRTVAVMATGIDRCYPPEHDGLLGRIAAHGAAITELLPGAPPAPGHFLTRNRIIAGLAGVTVLICAGARSGALSTARHALKLGRPVLVPAWLLNAEGHEGLGLAVKAGATATARAEWESGAWAQRLT